MPKSLPLAELRQGASARVHSVNRDGVFGRRLRDLGFQQGARVVCKARAPLGDPRVYEVAGGRICLRRGEAAAVRVLTDE